MNVNKILFTECENILEYLDIIQRKEVQVNFHRFFFLIMKSLKLGHFPLINGRIIYVSDPFLFKP